MLVNLPYLGLPAVSPATELLYLRAATVVSAAIYARWASLVINAICGYLGIKCLSIPYNKQKMEIPMNGTTAAPMKRA